MNNTLNFGLIGSGYMGKAYAIALHALPAIFNLSARPVCELLASSCAEGATAKARELGFNRSTADWRKLVEDPVVDVVAICTPTHLHREMALAAIAAGKHVICEKPLGLDSAEAETMVQAAEAAGVWRLHPGGFQLH